MQQTKLEKAIFALNKLLGSSESRENSFQKFLEENPIVFEVMGYKKAYPKLRFDLNNEWQNRLGIDYLEPDFIVERQDNIFEIFEIKTPQEKLLTKSASRKAFTAKINSYITQSINYSEYFNDSLNRKQIKQKYDLDFTRELDIIILVGCDKETDSKRVFEEIRKRTNRIQIITYSRLLNNLRFDYMKHYPSHSNLDGKYLFGIFEFRKMPKESRKYIFDYANSLDRNRISVYLNKNNRVIFEVIDKDGESFKAVGSALPLHERLSLFCQFGSCPEFSLLEISVNGIILLSSCFQEEIILETDFKQVKYSIGSSIDFDFSNSVFLLVLNSSGGILGFEERMNFDKISSKLVKDLVGSEKNGFEIGQGGCLYKKEHETQLNPWGNVKHLSLRHSRQ
jgi:hypothetical protein